MGFSQAKLFDQRHEPSQREIEALPGDRMQGMGRIAHKCNPGAHRLVYRRQGQRVMVTGADAGKPAQTPAKPVLKPTTFLVVGQRQNLLQNLIG